MSIQPSPQFLKASDAFLKWSVRLATVVTGEHTNIVLKISDDADEVLHRSFAYVYVKIAEVKDGKIIERRRQPFERERISPDDNFVSVAPRSAIQPGQFQRAADDQRRGVPIFEIKENQSLAKELGLMIGLNFQSPFYMFGANSLY